MAFEELMRSVQALTRNAETLAALGARLSGRAGGSEARPPVAGKLDAVAAALEPGLLDGIQPEEAGLIHTLVRANLRRMVDIVERPDQPARWASEDLVVLDAQGKLSRMVARLIGAHAAKEPELVRRLSRPGRFLDVGSGAGWISIAMAEAWPELSVDGIDIHPPALALADQNLAAAGLAGRVQFEHRSVDALDAEGAYAVAFMPLIFIPEPVVRASIPRLVRALEPGGWFFTGGYRVPETPLGRALVDLQTTLSGGRIWEADEVETLLGGHGFSIGSDIAEGTGINLYVARRPGRA